MPPKLCPLKRGKRVVVDLPFDHEGLSSTMHNTWEFVESDVSNGPVFRLEVEQLIAFNDEDRGACVGLRGACFIGFHIVASSSKQVWS